MTIDFTSSVLPRHELDRLARSITGGKAVRYESGSLDPDEVERLSSLATRRLGGEPLQYIEGTVDFGPVELAVDSRALIPRPETEQLWEQAAMSLGEAGPGTVIVDLCTGSGALALALKARFPEARVHATDISEEAISLAAENAARLGLDVALHHGDLFDALPSDLCDRIDLLVTNPPYVAEGEWPGLPVEIRDHEPRGALVAGESGFEFIERIALDAPWWLGVGGWLFCEIGETQGEAAVGAFGAWLDIDLRRDLAGRDRILVARKGARCCV
ncbi:MAG TPA: peptide chain release factor N(5)-glutamine methyltransferase [Acidimicrobiia bacterium]|nr:peptide chain release factor N(5)-glutamine methyltransferase [Acidimicrobiia bacterium]